MFERRFDVVVAGAGVAGIAAAVAAARRGLSVALLEKSVLTGGLATSGIVNIYLPLCDGNGTQVSYGITEEMLRRSLVYGPGEIPAHWRERRNAAEVERFRVAFSPASFTLALDEMLDEAGVEVWFDTLVTGATLEGERLAALTVVNKSGCGVIAGDCFVDATGDSDLVVLAGGSVHTGANALAGWTLEYRQGCNALARDCRVAVVGTATDPEVFEPGISGRTVTESIRRSRRLYREMLKKEYASGRFDRSTLFPLKVPAMADLRHTRCFDAPFALEPGMEWTRFEDSIGLAADWRRSGLVWEIPYRTLLHRQVRGVLAAGRCTAAHGDAWEVTRVIPVAALTGEVAGVAAAMAVRAGVTPELLPYEVLAGELRGNCRFPLHFADLGLERPAAK